MAVPDSLAAWREFVNRRNIEPEHLTMEQIRALSPGEKERYDQATVRLAGRRRRPGDTRHRDPDPPDPGAHRPQHRADRHRAPRTGDLRFSRTR